jgi:lipoprotein-anchoring transpeptidase ErfK/SrfK
LNTRIVSIGACAVLSAVVFAVSPGSAREIIPFKGYSAGTIVIKTNERRLYYVTGAGEAIRYPVGVGKGGMAWAGKTTIDGKYIKPAWRRQSRFERITPNCLRSFPAAAPQTRWVLRLSR